MCGICGAIGIDANEAAGEIVRRMMAGLVHRGPDEEGLLLTPRVAAGMRRLSIIDLPGGSQPVWNERQTLCVLFNGEIYNFRELRRELEGAGHQFRTHSDTEVIVHAFEQWGESCVRRLQGMFAFAVVEMPRGPGGGAERVFLARDPLGIKPLYYAIADGCFFFASEVRALLASTRVKAQLSAEAVPCYLLFGSVSEPLTLIEGIHSLPPGHSLMVSAAAPTAEVRPRVFWHAGAIVREDSGIASSAKQDSTARLVPALFENAVRSHLIADVPIGVFLSSGIDSTAIAAVASRMQPGIHTFTVAFPDLEYSEAEIARRTATRLGTDHCEINLPDSEMLSRLDEAIAGFDQPSMDGINSYFVSWGARQKGLKVALSGLGSDELFGGYPTFRNTPTLSWLARASGLFPRAVRDALAEMAQGLAPADSKEKVRKSLGAWRAPDSLPHPYFFARVLFAPESVAAAVGTGAISWSSAAWWKWLSRAAAEAEGMDEFGQVSWLELRSYLVNTLLRDTDCMSMRHSLEVRVPFLDISLVEYVLSLPASRKAGGSRPKGLLIEALGDALPQEILAQRKRTFTFPWENWLRGTLKTRISASLQEWSPALATLVDQGFAAKVWAEFLAGRTTWSRPWSLYVLNEWAKRNIPSAAAHSPERGSALLVGTN